MSLVKKVSRCSEIRTQDRNPDEEVELVVDERDDDVTEADDQNLAEEAAAGIGSDVAGRQKFPEKGGFAEEVKTLFRPGY